MTELTHTPGPWRVTGSVSDGMVDIDCDGGGCEGATVTGDNATANAQLMAAAPDLLDELRELIDTVQMVDPGVYSDAISYAQDAIDKATIDRSETTHDSGRENNCESG